MKRAWWLLLLVLLALVWRSPWTRKGNEADLERYRIYSRLSLGQPVDVTPLQEWNGDLGSVARWRPPPAGHHLPYRDFALEYPPGCLPLLLAPAPWAGNSEAYATAFCAQMALLLGGAVALLGRSRTRVVALTGVALLALGPIAVARLDAAPSFLICAALWAVGRQRPVTSGFCLALAAAIKLLPLLFFPLFLLYWGRHRGAGGVGRCLAGGALVALLLAPVIGSGWSNLVWMWSFHSGRPIEVESSYGCLLLLHRLVGGPEQILQAFGSTSLRGPGEGLWVSLAGTLPLLTAALLWWHCWRRRSLGLHALSCSVAALQVGLLVTVKVLSPQYLVLLVPLLISLEVAALDALVVLACALTQAAFPHSWGAISQGLWNGVLLLWARNATLWLLWGWLLGLLLRAERPGLPEEADEAPLR